MKTTITMLAILATLLMTWMSVALIGWALSDLTFKACASHGGTLTIMMIFGWIPAVVVGIDLSEYFNKQS
jgi:hypothetical protein